MAGKKNEKQNKNQATLPANFDPYDQKLKEQFHAQADEKNYILKTDKATYLACGAKRKGKTCKQVAGAGTDHKGYGRCKYHGGKNTGPSTAAAKKKVSQNARKHGFYSEALNTQEKEAYEDLLDEKQLGLEHEIYMLKAKVLLYLKKWRSKWDYFYEQKLAENLVKYKCRECFKETVRSDLDNTKYCPKCTSRQHLKLVESWPAERTKEEAAAYADMKTKVYYSESENGGRSFYHAGSIEDRALDRALNTLGRLIEKQARLTGQDGDSLLDNINAELRAASHGQVKVAWGSRPAQQRKEGGSEE